MVGGRGGLVVESDFTSKKIAFCCQATRFHSLLIYSSYNEQCLPIFVIGLLFSIFCYVLYFIYVMPWLGNTEKKGLFICPYLLSQHLFTKAY